MLLPRLPAPPASPPPDPEVERPQIRFAKRRRVADTIAALEAGGGSSSEDEGGSDGEEDAGDAGAALLDWRAKKSNF